VDITSGTSDEEWIDDKKQAHQVGDSVILRLSKDGGALSVNSGNVIQEEDNEDGNFASSGLKNAKYERNTKLEYKR
jgi:hypothetical protein